MKGTLNEVIEEVYGFDFAKTMDKFVDGFDNENKAPLTMQVTVAAGLIYKTMLFGFMNEMQKHCVSASVDAIMEEVYKLDNE